MLFDRKILNDIRKLAAVDVRPRAGVPNRAIDLSAQLGLSPLELLVTLTPHALPELFAVFLPLAAWTIASRRDAWDELLAATIVTTAIAIPLLLIAATIETWVTPSLLSAVSG